MIKAIPHSKTKKKIKYSNSKMKRDLEEISKEISKWDFDYILGINRGGAVPSVYLSHILEKPMTTIDWSMRDDMLPGGNVLSFSTMSDLNRGKKILLVDDIIDDGDTVYKLLQDWAKRNTNLSGLKIFSIFYNKNNKRGLQAHYYCHEHNPNHWVVYDWEKN